MRGDPRTCSALLAPLALLALIWLAPDARADAEVRRADPLEVPSGEPPQPEGAAALASPERIRAAAAVLRAQGHSELPVLAWALLAAARSQQQEELAEFAVELAPRSPGVRFEAARLTRDPRELVAALVALAQDLPGILWLVSLAAMSLLGGLLALALGVCLVAALRGLPLHGHALGHRLRATEPPAWPGVLLCVAGFCVLPLFGVGSALVAATAGALGALRLERDQALRLALVLVALGVTLGLGLERVTPALVAASRESDLIAAWRIDRGEALPGDLASVERASARDPGDLLLRFALATDWKRRGDLAQVLEVLGDPSTSPEPALRSASFNLRGIARLAEGNLSEAIPAFERARAADETAPVMFNLSQAYGRALLLSEQQSAFAAASSLDDELVNRYLAAEGASVHSVLIQMPLSLPLYLSRALEQSTESKALARELRERLLGPLEPDRLWMALPLIGALAFLLHRGSVTRCSRCQRPLCAHCSREAMLVGTCTPCVRLFASRETTDPRMRKQQLDLDRRRERHAQIRLALGGLVAPGAADLVERRWLRGAASLVTLGIGLAMLSAPAVLPLPWDLGALGLAAPYAIGALLVAPLYAFGLAQGLGRLSGSRRGS